MDVSDPVNQTSEVQSDIQFTDRMEMIFMISGLHTCMHACGCHARKCYVMFILLSSFHSDYTCSFCYTLLDTSIT